MDLTNGADKVEAVNRHEVLGRLSHDLRNPLNLIGTALALLEVAPDTERPRAVAWVRNAVDQMTSILHDQLELARLEAGEAGLRRDRLNAEALVSAAAAALAQARPGIAVSAEGEPGLHLAGDPDLLVKALRHAAEFLLGRAGGASAALAATRVDGGVRLAVRVIGGEATVARAEAALRRPSPVPRPAELGMAIAGAVLAGHGGEVAVRPFADDGPEVPAAGVEIAAALA